MPLHTTPDKKPPALVGKEPFDIDELFRRLRQAVKLLPKAAMLDLRDRGVWFAI